MDLSRLPVVLITLLASAAAVAAPPAAYAPRALTPSAASADVDLLRAALTRIHPGYGRYASVEATDALLDDLAARAAAGMTDEEMYRAVSLLLARIRCDHTKAELPAALSTHRDAVPSYLPFSFRLPEGRMIVDEVDPDQPGLARGDEILSINGRGVGDVIADVEPYLSVDGWTDDTKRPELEFSSELRGDAIDHFWPFLHGWPKEWTLRVRGPGDGAVRTVTLAPVTYGRWLETATAGDTGPASFETSVAFRMLDETTAYLSIGTFINYRDPVDPAAVLGPHFAAMREAGAEHLVHDLRACGGGSDDVPGVLLSYLADRPVVPAKRLPWVRTYRVADLRPHLSTWDEAVFGLPDELFGDLGNGFFEMSAALSPESLTAIEPRAERFTGSVTALVGPANASGATIFLALLDAHCDDVRFVGAPTGGSAEGPTAGLIFFLKLPGSGVTVRVPAIRSFVNVESFTPGRGIDPDVRVRETVEDVRAGRDAVLEAALGAAKADAYLERALDEMERLSLKRDSVDWPALRTRARAAAGGATREADTHDAIRGAIAEIADGHSFLYVPAPREGGEADWGEAWVIASRSSDLEGRLLEGGVGYLLVPSFGGEQSWDPAVAAEFAGRIQSEAGRLVEAGATRWIVDLRFNSGGNMWPMLAGLGPLLGDGDCGAFVGGDGSRVTWRCAAGSAGTDGNPAVRLADPMTTMTPRPAVAVLTARTTLSSGEAVVTAFRGRPASRSFGASTGGASTATQTIWLGDGAMLFLTTAVYADRTGRTYGGPIEPDVAIESDTATPADRPDDLGDDPVVRAALDWLASPDGP